MTEHLQRDMEQIKQGVLAMGGLVEEALRSACVAFTQRDESRTEDMQQLEVRIDRMQLELDDEILKVLALHQPVATDIRFVTAAMKIVNDLERIGDLSTNIAERMLETVRAPHLGEPVAHEKMMEQAGDMLRDALNAFVHGDTALARSVLERDDEIDRLNRRHFEILLPRMKRDPDAVETAMAMLSISRNVERVADLATNIAEDVIFVVEAKDIRHQGLAGPDRP